MSKHDSSLSKDQYNLLKDLKSKLVILSLRLNLLPCRENSGAGTGGRPRSISQADARRTKIDAGNIAKIEKSPKKKSMRKLWPSVLLPKAHAYR